jgi:hypothetical protein
MIRRDPTLILMSDADVEDVRKMMIAQNRKALNEKLAFELKAKGVGLDSGVFNQ